MTAWNASVNAQPLASVPDEIRGTRAAVFHVLRMHDRAKTRAKSAASPGGLVGDGLVNSQETKAAAGVSRPAARCLPDNEPIVRGATRLVSRKTQTGGQIARTSAPVYTARRPEKAPAATEQDVCDKLRYLLDADEFDFAS